MPDINFKKNSKIKSLKSSNSSLLNILITFFSIVFLLVLFELGLRIYEYLQPITISDKQRGFIETMTIPESYGIVRPHVHVPDMREYFPTGKNIDLPVPISTNAFGMRMREIDLKKRDHTIRIAAMGDSCTFGWMVLEQDCYPRILETLLNQQSDRHYEVLNFGVPGYTSFHGLKQYERSVKHFKPDILILGFGFNDWFECRFSEQEFYARLARYGFTRGLSGIPLFLYDHSALGKWIINRIHSRAKSTIEEEIHQRADNGVWHAKVYPRDYKEHLRTLINDAKEYDAKSLLLHINLANTWIKKELHELASDMNLPILDAQDLFIEKALSNKERKAKHLGLKPYGQYPGKDNVYTLKLRVKVPENVSVPDSIYVVGNHPAIGDWSPNTIRLYDDGSHGDEIAGDRIWSIQIQIQEALLLDYTFTNSGPLNKWIKAKRIYENPDKSIRHYFHVDLTPMPAGTHWISPIHTLNKIPYEDLLIPGDPIHPNKTGYRLIAEHLAPIVRAGVKCISKEGD